MTSPDLNDLVLQLRQRLAEAKTLDTESRGLLTVALQDIEQALSSSELPTPAATESLEAMAVQFEAEHPVLVVGLRRVVDALGKVGI